MFDDVWDWTLVLAFFDGSEKSVKKMEPTGTFLAVISMEFGIACHEFKYESWDLNGNTSFNETDEMELGLDLL